MALTPKDAFDAARDIAAHAVEKASDIVEDAGAIIRGDISGGVNAIVQDSMEIATHAVGRAREVFVDSDETEDAEGI
ncbi:Rv1893 family protein [Mycolicibacter minnesotensis]